MLHTLLYVEGIAEALMKGVDFHPGWVFHVAVCTFLLLQIPRPRKFIFFAAVVYCLVIPTQMIRGEYGNGENLADELELMFRTLLLFIPLYLAAASLLVGRAFYLGQATGLKGSSG